ncbi:hypothetical protein F8M41_011602 [Gigaspora margarita]|uniref:Uncharacterized protein n=1 Tax=Gigaspora margarita TaxID=4874 RepID=A0A8H3X0J3_GIGMA|nr:hypothetical protein F8M41_011602 [Gigaspora margarita]
MDNFSESLQEFLLHDYSYDEVQEDLINVEDMISSDDEKEYDNDPVFDLEQSLYDVEDIPILQETSDDKTGNEYTEEILAIKTKQFTPCVIIDNDHEEIQCCNRESVKGLQELIGVWEIDKDPVNNVNKELHCLGVCLKYFNYDQNTVHSKKLKDECCHGYFQPAVYSWGSTKKVHLLG